MPSYKQTIYDPRLAMSSKILLHVEDVLDKLTGLAQSYWFVLTCRFLVESSIEHLPMQPPRGAIWKKARVKIHAEPTCACQSIIPGLQQSDTQFICRYVRSLGIDG